MAIFELQEPLSHHWLDMRGPSATPSLVCDPELIP